MFTLGIWEKMQKRGFNCLSIATKGIQYTYTTNMNACLKKVIFSRKLELMNFK